MARIVPPFSLYGLNCRWVAAIAAVYMGYNVEDSKEQERKAFVGGAASPGVDACAPDMQLLTCYLADFQFSVYPRSILLLVSFLLMISPTIKHTNHLSSILRIRKIKQLHLSSLDISVTPALAFFLPIFTGSESDNSPTVNWSTYLYRMTAD